MQAVFPAPAVVPEGEKKFLAGHLASGQAANGEQGGTVAPGCSGIGDRRSLRPVLYFVPLKRLFPVIAAFIWQEKDDMSVRAGEGC